MSGEDELIAWLRGRVEKRGWCRLGDDAAELPEGRYLTTVDTQIAGVHFVPDLDPILIARRLLAVNLSDLAAMGAEPAFAFLALSAPADFDHRPFFDALIEACDHHGVELAGGDLSTQPRLTAVLTLLGHRQERVVTRDGGRPGHRLWLGGAVGESALGCRLIARGARLRGRRVELPEGLALSTSAARAARRAVRRHLAPAPQLDLGRWLAKQGEGAAIDISDGLARDLHRLCRASRVGADVEASAIEAPHGALSVALGLGCSWRELAFGGGEDYVLLFTLPPEIEPPPSFGCQPIGRLVRGQRVRVREADGSFLELPPTGFDHLHDPGKRST